MAFYHSFAIYFHSCILYFDKHIKKETNEKFRQSNLSFEIRKTGAKLVPVFLAIHIMGKIIAFVAKNIPYKIFMLLPFITISILIYFCMRLFFEYTKEKVHVRRTVLSYGLSTFIVIIHVAYFKFNWSYSLIDHTTAIPFIINLLWMLGVAILYFLILVLVIGLCIFAIIERFHIKE